MKTELNIALAQLSPVWLNKTQTLDKVKQAMNEGAENKADLIVFGEGYVSGYPFWLALTEGAKWDLKINKEIHAHYMHNAVQIEAGELDEVCALAKKNKIAVYLGIIEKAANRGGHSLYCSLVYINKSGEIKSVHRKLQPTYDERLTWSPGDGNGLKTHALESFTVGGLNCWENWMPLVRASLYAQGENVHIAVWPGSTHNTQDITRFIARESRSYVISVSSLMTRSDFPSSTPYYETLIKNADEVLANGGSCVAGPDGEWLLEPIENKEGVYYCTIELDKIYQERQNFDPSGHYSRPDITSLTLNQERQQILKVK